MIGVLGLEEHEGEGSDLFRINFSSWKKAYFDEEVDNTQNNDKNMHESELSPNWGTPLFTGP